MQVLTPCCSNPELHEVTQRNIVLVLAVASLNGRYTQSALCSEPHSVQLHNALCTLNVAACNTHSDIRGLAGSNRQGRVGSEATVCDHCPVQQTVTIDDRHVKCLEITLFCDVRPCSSFEMPTFRRILQRAGAWQMNHKTTCHALSFGCLVANGRQNDALILCDSPVASHSLASIDPRPLDPSK